MILWEGIDSLTLDELRKACAERGMRAIGLTEVCKCSAQGSHSCPTLFLSCSVWESQAGYRRQLRQWLDLSINKAVPTSLLILSRAFTITSSVSAVFVPHLM
jgi:LETM1 and EF-hand domain-containing protein 1, mitochondrial